MMEARELRIGNYVLVKERDDFSFQVNEDSISNFAKGTLEIRAIPLTEEWLVRFGFEKSDINIDEDQEESCFYTKEFNQHGMKREFIVNDIYNSAHFTLADIDLTVEIEYIHQLQNLYFALTGQELILK